MAARPTITIVLDTAAILAGLGPAQGPGAPGTRWVVPPAVQAEVRPGGPTGRALESALGAGLEVLAPSELGLDRVRTAATERGELARLSKADVDVLALAVDGTATGPVELWTDDYAVQNLAAALQIPTRPVLTRGIREEATWYVRCTGCARYPEAAASGDTCPVCGSPLKRTRKAPAGRRTV